VALDQQHLAGGTRVPQDDDGCGIDGMGTVHTLRQSRRRARRCQGDDAAPRQWRQPYDFA
jgi:hypothetical protein